MKPHLDTIALQLDQTLRRRSNEGTVTSSGQLPGGHLSQFERYALLKCYHITTQL